MKTTKRLVKNIGFSNQIWCLLWLCLCGVMAQGQSIKGTVSDKQGPLPGVNVFFKDSSKGTTTDFDGNFELEGANQGSILVFSYIGYKSKEITLTGNIVNVTLEEDTQALEEVVVVGYGVQKKKDLTGSISSIGTDDIQKTNNVSLDQAIQGRAAGVTVSGTSGAPGASPTVRIRGTGTVNNSDPLYVIDGVPINDIANFNMADAASIDVLKDASATAIYGSRGANGVILIQTKKGSKRRTSISYNVYTGTQSRIDNLDILSGPDWAMLVNEAHANDGTDPDPGLANYEGLPTYNWKDVAYRSGTIQDHQLSISGGSDKSTYYLSYGYITQDGLIKESGYHRHNFRVNNTYRLNDRIRIGHNIQYSNSSRSSIPESGNNPWRRAAFVGYVVDPVSPIYAPDGGYGIPGYSSAINPLGLIEFGKRNQKKESFFGNLFVELDLAKDLLFKSNYGLEITNVKSDNYIPEYFVGPTYNSPVSEYNLGRSENRVMVLSNTLNYIKEFNNTHNLNLLMGQEIQNLTRNNVQAGRSEVPSSVAHPTLGSGNVSTSTNNGGISDSKLLSFFGRLNYNFDDRYLITATYRFDGSSRFGENRRWGEFPSVALGWNVHNESFFNTNFVNQFKFRAGWGETGNQNIPLTATFNTLNLNTNYVFGEEKTTTVGAAPLRPGNQDLKWETTVTKNLGLDLGLFNNSLSLTADYFIKNTTDLLLAIPILDTSGYQTSPFGNAGNIENKGIELTATYRKSFGDFSFDLGGNISFIKNEVLSLADDGILIGTNRSKNYSRTEVGHPIASFYGYEMIGIFQTQDEVDNSAILPKTQPGDVKYRDLNNDGIIDDNDRKYIGSPFPDYTYGINLDMNYKQFDMSIFFQGSQGNDIINHTIYWLEADLGTNMSTNMLNRWTGEGTSNTIPRVTFANNGVNMPRSSSRYVRDGSYARLKNVQLGYTIPQKVMDKTPISSLRLYLAAQNLFTFTKYGGMDPEVSIDDANNGSPLDIGIDAGVYPSSRTITMGMNVKF